MPASDFSSHDPAFSPEQVEQCARIIDGIRKINAKIVRLSGSLDSLASAADRVEALLESLAEVTQARALQSFRFAFDRDRPNDVLPFNPATGEFNPIAPKLAMALDGKKLVTHCEFSNCYESGAGPKRCRAAWWPPSTTSCWPTPSWSKGERGRPCG